MLKKGAGHGKDAPKDEKRSGTIAGEIKSKKEQGNNIVIEVLAPGEEKARSYFVQYDPKIKGPIPEILKRRPRGQGRGPGHPRLGGDRSRTGHRQVRGSKEGSREERK